MKVTLRPIEQWPGTLTKSRKRSQFSASQKTTMKQLDYELTQLGAKDVVFQIAVREEDFRLDGKLRAHARHEHPGVIVSFQSKFGPLQYACDTYWDYDSNVRAIALGLEALRAVDRYGISRRGEQYTGYRALGSGMAMPAAEPTMTAQEAARFICKHAGIHDATWGSLISGAYEMALGPAYRMAAKALHPDAGGSQELFQKLQEAKRIVDGARS